MNIQVLSFLKYIILYNLENRRCKTTSIEFNCLNLKMVEKRDIIKSVQSVFGKKYYVQETNNL